MGVDICSTPCYIKNVRGKTPQPNNSLKSTKMNKTIKAFSLGLAGAAAALALNIAAPTKAEAGTCWFDNGRGSLSPTYCQTQRRINHNGHVVFDVVDHRGTKMTLVLWDDNTAEMIMNGQIINARATYDRQGDLRLETANGFEMAIRL